MADNKSLWTYFSGAFYGALILITIMYVLMLTGAAGRPGFVNIYESTFSVTITPLHQVLAAFLFALSGGVWGIIFRVIPKPNPLKGMLFGLLPSLWLWVVVVPFTGGEIFNGFAIKGILFPLIFNCVIWGSFLGWYVSSDK